MNLISTNVRRIREVITPVSVAAEISKNRRSWLHLTSGLDVVEDTELAIESYEGRFGTPMEFGAGYLEVYGVLQAMVVQQDAVRRIAESIGVQADQHDILKKIRDIRNQAIGHPTNRCDGTSHYITRVTMRWEGFRLLTAGHESDERDSSTYIDLADIIPKQRSIIVSTLAKCADEMESRFPLIDS